MIFHNLLRCIRIKQNISIKDAAANAGISAANLRSMESGKTKPSVASIVKLEKAYNIPQGGLLDAIGSIEMRRIYVSYPMCSSREQGEELRTTIERNKKKVSEICRSILMNHKDVLILSPVLAFEFISYQHEQTALFEQCKALLEQADELWFYGDWQNSIGCQSEIRYAEILKIPVRYF